MFFSKQRAYSFIEVIIVVAIMGITATLAVTLYNPGAESKHRKVETQLGQLKDAIVIHNARHPEYLFQNENTDGVSGPPWWVLLPGVHDAHLIDPWGNPYEHDFYKGAVYSSGPNMENEDGTLDDIVVYYRPPSAEIYARYPNIGQVIN